MTETSDRDSSKLEERRAAMMGIVGIWKDRTDSPDTETYVRNLRKGTRLKRLHDQWRPEQS